MTPRRWTGVAAMGCAVAALALEPPTLAGLREPALWLLRPAALPFAWRALDEAMHSGDAAESFARAQQIANLLPAWTDAQIVFAFRFATAHGSADPTIAANRLQVALAWLASARDTAGRREVELLQAMALLPELALGVCPELEPKLRDDGGSAGLADRYLAEAERISGSAAVREQRTFLVPTIAGALLGFGDRERAIAVLATGIARSADVRDRELATAWAARLDEVSRYLQGESVDLTAVRADLRMAPLLPHLR